MSSILSSELIEILKLHPDYEVIMEITTKYNVKSGASISYINGCKIDDEFREIRLMN